MNIYSMTQATMCRLLFCAVILPALGFWATAQAGALNDTGVTSCSNGTATVACSSVDATHPGQDASFGRDAAAATGALTKVGSGPAGFDFTKLSMDGTVVSDSAAMGSAAGQHACTRDNVTGLVWDVLKGMAVVAWYVPDSAVNGGNPGSMNQGPGIDTNSYLATANSNNQCGGTGWRLPTVRELLSVNDLGQGRRPNGYFSAYQGYCPPHGPFGMVWSSQTVRGNSSAVWYVTQDGRVLPHDKGTSAVTEGAVNSVDRCAGTWFLTVMMVR